MTINRTVLREQVKDVLLERILNGVYLPGDRLIETQIAQELGTSQAPVREALRDLESMRFVESQAFRGARVRDVSSQEIAEIYPVRAALEELAGREAAQRLSGDIAPLQAEFDAMMRAARDGDLHLQVHHDVAFHRTIVEASGNRILIDVWKSLRIEPRTLITALKAHIDAQKMAELHRPILDAVRKGDPEETGSALRVHMQTFADVLVKGKSL